MMVKWIGALFIILSCFSFGIIFSLSYKKELNSLNALIHTLDFMECELQFRMTPLPELCRKTAMETDGVLRKVFTELSNELEDQISPDVQSCMYCVINRIPNIPQTTKESLNLLGKNLGRFDLQGQLRGLETVREESRIKLNKLLMNSDMRIKSYQTIGLCAGAALVILLI